MAAIYLIRHGQASFGKSDYDKLSSTGHKQAAHLGVSLRGRGVTADRAYSGTMKRHRQTAERCLESMGSELIPTTIAGFNEYDHEQLVEVYEPRYANKVVMMADMARTLQPRRAFQEFFARAVERWVAGEHDDEYSESWRHFCERCVGALGQVHSELGKGETAFVFTSGGTITAIGRHLLSIPDAEAFRMNWGLANCGITKVISGRGGLTLSCLNEHSAFEGHHADLLTYR